MKKTDLRSNYVRALIYIFAFISALGLIIPITSYLTDTTFWKDTIEIDKNNSIGLGIIMVATTGGIGMAFAVRRRNVAYAFNNYYCKKNGDKMYEDQNHEKIYCPSHGEQKIEFWEIETRHYEFLSPKMLKQKIEDKKIKPRNQTTLPRGFAEPRGLEIPNHSHSHSYRANIHGFSGDGFGGVSASGGASGGGVITGSDKDFSEYFAIPRLPRELPKELRKKDLEYKISELESKLTKLSKQLDEEKDEEK
jgi:hypothetical protein